MKRALRLAFGAAAAIALLVLLEAALTGRLSPRLRMNEYVYGVLLLAGINVILAASLNLINGFTGQFSIGHVGFMAIGGYAAALVSTRFGGALAGAVGGAPDWLRDAAVLVPATAAGMLVAGFAGFIVGIPSLRLRGDYLAIVTLGFGEIILVVIRNVPAVGGARGFSGIPQLSGFAWIFGGALVTVLVVRNLVCSSFGRGLISIRDDEIAAEAMGVHTTRLKVTSFVISSALAGLAGSLFAHYEMYLHPNSFTFIRSFEIIIMIVIGGLGSITGSVVGAFLFIVLSELLGQLKDLPAVKSGMIALLGHEADPQLVVFSLLLIVIMLTRPQGLLGHWELPFFRPRRGGKAGRDTAPPSTDAAPAAPLA